MIDRTVAPAARRCQRSSATEYDSQITNPRVAPMGPQGPPVPCASLHTNGTALRGRVPPMDYRDNPQRSPKSRAAAE